MILIVPPNFDRAGVAAGFALDCAGGAATCTKGVLFAQGVMYRPASAPVIPAPPLGRQSWLYYNSVSGFYWQAALGPVAADDAYLGWALADSTRIVAVSQQLVIVPDPTGPTPVVIGLGPVSPAEPDGGAYGDTGIPEALGWSWRMAKPGQIEFFELAANINRHSIRRIMLMLFYRQETDAAVGELTADVAADATILPVGDGTKFYVGAYYLIDREMVLVKAIDANNLTVERDKLRTEAAPYNPQPHFGPKAITAATNATPVVVSCAGHGRQAGDVGWISGSTGNTAANAGWVVASPVADSFTLAGSGGNGAYAGGGTLAGSRIYLVEVTVATFTFEPLFFDGPDAANWSGFVTLPNALMLAQSAFASNAFGEADRWVRNTVGSAWSRTGFGGQISLAAEGVLGIESDLAPPVNVPSTVSVNQVWASVKNAPSGAKVTAVVKANGVAWATLTIADGAAISAVLDGRALAPLVAGTALSMDVTAVGSTFPGERLVVTIQL